MNKKILPTITTTYYLPQTNYEEKIKELVYYSKEKIHTYDSHCLKDYSELDYLKKYQQYFPDIMAIELENSIKEQLEVKDYLQKRLFSSSKL